MQKLLKTSERAAAISRARELFKKGPFDLDAYERNEPYLSYEEQFSQQLERTAAAVDITLNNPSFMFKHMKQEIQMADMFETNGLAGIHFTMFLTFLKTNGSDEQKKRWLSLAQEAKYFGAYAQTELGHGSNVRGLETTATFIKESDEFEIHSPTLTSMKWWPTGIYACTHAVVFANLIIDGKPYGIQGFMVQLRDEQGNTMPGVEVGEIGPKIAAGHTNIGYASFNRLRIPRFNMFSKLFQVKRDGTFIAPPPKVGKIKNISMMMMRVMNVSWAARDTSKAAVIACRYSAVRKQGYKEGRKGEEQTILDYSNQQYRCFRALALSYQFFFNSRHMNDYLGRVQTKITMGDMSAADELPELHASISAMKAYSTVEGHLNIEELRKAMGGQGFLRSSGIADIAVRFMEPVTVEGEQIILSLQVGRFLIKSVSQLQSGKQPKGSVKYLLEKPLAPLPDDFAWIGCVDQQIALLRDRARSFAFRLAKRFSEAQKSGMTFNEATNHVAVFSYAAARKHAAYVMARNNLVAIKEYITDAACRDALMKLLELSNLIQIYENSGDFMGLLRPTHLDSLFDSIMNLCKQIRPDAIGLSDGFAYDDYQLGSTLGVYSGNVYEAIVEEARRSPLNKTRKMVGWEKLKPCLDLDFLKAGVGQRCAASKL